MKLFMRAVGYFVCGLSIGGVFVSDNSILVKLIVFGATGFALFLIFNSRPEVKE